MIQLRSLPYIIDKFRGSQSIIDKSGGLICIDGFGKNLASLTNPIFEKAKKSLGNREATEIIAVNGIEKQIMLALKSYPDLLSTMRLHLGDVSFDVSYTFATNYGEKSHRGSQLWHHDSVGRRLKLFLTAHPDSSPSLFVENKRGGSISKPNIPLEERKLYSPTNAVKNISMQPDDAYIVDTDYLHRGKIGMQGEQRLALVVEFSSKLKTLCRGRVGRRMNP